MVGHDPHFAVTAPGNRLDTIGAKAVLVLDRQLEMDKLVRFDIQTAQPHRACQPQIPFIVFYQAFDFVMEQGTGGYLADAQICGF